MSRPSRPALALALAGSLSGAARAEISLKERIDLQSRKLSEVRDRRKTVDRRLKQLTSQLADLEAKLKESRRVQGELEEQIRTLTQQAARATNEVERARLALEEARWAHEHYEEAYSRRLVHHYKRAALSPIGPLLESRSLAELVRRSRYHRFLREDAGQLRGLEESRDAVAERTRNHEETKRRAETLKLELETRQRELTKNILEQTRLVGQIRRERAHESDKRNKLAEAQRKLAKTIRNLSEADRVARSAGDRPPARRAPKRGRLRWPLDQEKTVLKPFGRTTNETGTPEFNSGIDLLVTQPRSVKATADGRVLFQGIFSAAYGKVVMLDHGGRPVKIISLYGNLDTILVGPNQEVREGDAIGTIGGSAASSQHLKFEIRRGTDPEDPIRWLAPR